MCQRINAGGGMWHGHGPARAANGVAAVGPENLSAPLAGDRGLFGHGAM